MKLQTFSKLSVGVALLFSGVASNAVTFVTRNPTTDPAMDLGFLSVPGTVGGSSANTAADTNFTDTWTFNTSAIGFSLSVLANNTYSDTDDKIKLFSASLALPGGGVTSLDGYVDDPDFGTQSYTRLFYNAPAGSYSLTVNGQTALYASNYQVSIATTVPEPKTVVLMLAGIAVVGFFGARRKTF